jgi:predicted RNA-binding Zn-ribbon protein involved in translation (DUF1610 family)
MQEQSSDTVQLAKLHKASSPTLARKPLSFFLLWYADLDLHIGSRSVSYHCPECGRPLMMPTEEFIERDNNTELRCNSCRGYHDERGGGV